MAIALSASAAPRQTRKIRNPVGPRLTPACEEEWRNFRNAEENERSTAMQANARYYVPAESNEDVVRLRLGSPYPDIDHQVCPPLNCPVDDQIHIWATPVVDPPVAGTDVLPFGLFDPRNVPFSQVAVRADQLPAHRLIKLEVKYLNTGGDGHYFITIGGTGICAGGMWCNRETKKLNAQSELLAGTQIWRSALRAPKCK
jgi:hypothetical protein